MHYYEIEFSYPPPFTNIPGDSECDMLLDTDKKIDEKLKLVGLEFRHSYCWTDGAIYKWVKTNLGIHKLYDLLLSAIHTENIDINSVNILKKSFKTHKLDLGSGNFLTIEMAFKKCRFARKT